MLEMRQKSVWKLIADASFRPHVCDAKVEVNGSDGIAQFVG
jgi:hypothetical protein